MGQENGNSPDEEIGDETGSETQYRYNFQAMCAAIFSLLLLKEPQSFTELFCEQQEDILLKKPNGKYEAIQVKTRTPSGYRFITNDRKIIDTLKRFIELDLKFPDSFESFVIVTNCGFTNVRDDYNNLPKMLSRSKDGTSLDEHKKKYKVVYSKMLEVEYSDETQIHEVLSKTECQRIGDFDAIIDKLSRAISEMGPPWSNQNLSELDTIAISLTDEMVRASSITFETSTNIYDAVLGVSESDQISRIVEQRRITKQRVTDIIQQAISDYNLLKSAGSIDASSIGTAIQTFYDKMEKGGISKDNQTNLLDQKHSTQNLLIELGHRKGREYMESIFEHLGMEVRDVWLELFDNYQRNRPEPFGQELLENLKPRIRSLYEVLTNSLELDYNYQHIMGIVGILTEMCPIRWSVSYPGGPHND